MIQYIILDSVDHGNVGKISILAALDMSAAFLTLLTMPLYSIDSNTLLACLGTLFPGFIHICPNVHPVSKWTHHLPLKLHLQLEFHQARSWDLFVLFCSYPRSRVSFNQTQNCQTRKQLFLSINMLMTLSFTLVQTHPHSSLKSPHSNPAPLE